jgi:GTPase SAR1 family protein
MVQVIRDKILNHLVSSLFQLLQKLPLTVSQGSEWVPIVIVGNKSDLRPDQRQVSVEEGKELAVKFNCAYTEASARYNENVSKAFDLMIGQIEKAQNPNEPTGGANTCNVM